LDQHGILGGAVKSLDFQVLLDPLEKEFDLCQATVELSIIQVGPVNNQQIARFEMQVLDGLAVPGLAVGDDDALGQHLGQHGVELDGPFVGPELGPGKDGGGKVNGSGIDDFDL